MIPPVCPTCMVGCLYEASALIDPTGAAPSVVMERHYCPRCGWNPETDG